MNSEMVIVVCQDRPELGAKGVSLILVEDGTPGFSKGRKLEKVGLMGQDTSELFFDNVKVPKGNLLGEEGMGFKYLMQELAAGAPDRRRRCARPRPRPRCKWTWTTPASARPSARPCRSSRTRASSWPNGQGAGHQVGARSSTTA